MMLLRIIRYMSIETVKLTGIYVIWSLVHLLSANLYTYYCANLSFYGYIISLFNTMTPHCSALHYFVSTGKDIVVLMWKTLGTWFITNVVYHSATKINENIHM